jgi:WD40 repeat protein
MSAAFSPDGRRALTGGVDGTAKLWDLGTGRLINTFQGHSRPVLSVAFSPDGGQALAASGDHMVSNWELETGRQLNTFRGWEIATGRLVKTVTDFAKGDFSGERQLLAGRAADGSVRLSSAQTGALLLSIVEGADGEWIAFTPAGFFNASPGGEKLLYLVRGVETIPFAERAAKRFHHPDLVEQFLQGDRQGLYKRAADEIHLGDLFVSRK